MKCCPKPLLVCALLACMLQSGCVTEGKGADSGQPDAADAGPEVCDIVGPSQMAFMKAGRTDGGVLIPGGVMLTPAGDTVATDVFPMNLLKIPGRELLVVTNDGRNFGEDTQTLQVVDLRLKRVVQTIVKKGPYALFLGLAATADGKRVYAAGASRNMVYVFDVGAGGTLTERTPIAVPGFPGAVALSKDGKRMVVAQQATDTVAVIDMEQDPPVIEGVIGVGVKSANLPNAYPYHVVVSGDGKTAYVSNWGDMSVSIVDLQKMEKKGSVNVGKNPEGLALSPDGSRLYAANSDTDDISVIDTASMTETARYTVNASEDSPIGASPTMLALSPDGAVLYAASAGSNTVDLISTSDGRVLGRMPTAWYPTAIGLDEAGERLFAGSAKGLGGGPNRDGVYPPSLETGMLQIIELGSAMAGLETLTSQAERNNRRQSGFYEFPCKKSNSPVPITAGDGSPIKHVVFIVKENKTYDQVFGDLQGTDADPALVMFGEKYTPNMHKLAREFSNFDNFYVESDVSVQGHMWCTASVSNDFNEKSWLSAESGRVYLPGIEPAGHPATEFIFHHLLARKVSFVIYGEAVGTIADIYGLYGRGEKLKKYADENWPGGVIWTTVPRDEERARYFAERLAAWADSPDGMPQFIFMVLPNDHTNGLTPGSFTPESMVSDNDYGLGLIIEALSASKFWPETAVFVTEDDPQSGADHVDSHRSICLVISPYAKRGYTSGVHYSIPNIFRTIELILGVPPMNNYDARAAAMYDAFTPIPDPEPYTALPRNIPDEIVPGFGLMPEWMKGLAEESMKMDFGEPDSPKNHLLGTVLKRYFQLRP